MCILIFSFSILFCSILTHHTNADFFLSVGLGLGGTDTPEVKLRKSISNERTFSATADETLLFRKLGRLLLLGFVCLFVCLFFFSFFES